jgi:hypothetical protein
MPTLKRLLIALVAALAVCAFATSSAFASTKQVTIVEETNGLNANPMITLETLKAMGVTEVKYSIDWEYLLSSSEQNVTTPPAGSSTPSFYYPDFSQLTTIDQDAAKVGVKLDVLVGSPVPRWAEGSTAGCSTYAVTNNVCDPSAADFAVFVAGLGSYFNGSQSGVPAIRWWSIWNEPNYGVNLSPQMVNATTYSGADQYRSLVDAAWTALTATGHTTATDTILFGDLAPRGIAGPTAGSNSGIKPVQFLASLYCVTTSGKRLAGAAATANGCPSTSAAFRADNPALFDASGIADHPYSQGIAPTIKTADCKIAGTETACASGTGRPADPLWTDLAGISNLENGLDKDVRAEGASKKFPIWSTEYGYWTTLSSVAKYHCRLSYQADCDASPANAEIYSNEAEYISYHNSRIASFDQYQLYMPPAGSSAWSDGLLTAAGKPEVTFDPWEIPLWIPTTSLSKAGNITVWGGAKPAYYDELTYKAKPQVAIQFKAKTGGWKTVKTVTVPASASSPGSYFQTTYKVSKSGSLRLAYTANRATLYSRTQAITVK